ncbi:MAG: hypothetical protein CMH59_13055, partial [Myxococcales bacterium]|nr:hypothetical protein [Myxococcales bacterium]
MSAEPTGGWSRDLGEREPAPVGASGVERFGRYLLCYELAAGGMGTVYLARAVGPAGFDRPVAIKRIHPHLAHQQRLVEMFLDEARITSRVNHPNVCSVFDFGEVDGTYYIALEYLLGESVHALLAELERDSGALDAPRWQTIAARVVADACEGLHAAHTLHDDRGRPLRVVHRDVSPQNLFVTYDGATKVLDFGVARAEDRLHQTVAGDVKGKYAYMAPEQVSGREVDARADVWALGVCLWEMLVGERLFREPSEMDTILAVRSRAIPAPSARRASVSPALDAICLRALERDPKGRWPSARAMGRALEEALRQQPMPTGLADVADWMRARFARRRTRKRELVETVLASSASLRAHPAGTATPSLAPPAASVPPPPPRPRGGARRRSAGTVTPSMAPPARPPRPPRRPTPTATPSVPPPPPPRAKAAKSSVAPPPKRVAAP